MSDEQERLKAQLQDPTVVHAAMLRGHIATPTVRTILHVYGAEALAARDALDDAIRALTDTLDYEWDGEFRPEIERLNQAYMRYIVAERRATDRSPKGSGEDATPKAQEPGPAKPDAPKKIGDPYDSLGEVRDKVRAELQPMVDLFARKAAKK
jgi:hypothetical protein